MFRLFDLFKKDKEKYIIPKGVQDVIPVKRIWRDGVFLVGKNKYSKTFKFTDINYIVASEEDKESMFLDYMQILNSFECEMLVKISILNSKMNEQNIENNIKIENEKDRLDRLRSEYNRLIDEGAKTSNGIVQEKYITITIKKKSMKKCVVDIRYHAAVGDYSRILVVLTSHQGERTDGRNKKKWNEQGSILESD